MTTATAPSGDGDVAAQRLRLRRRGPRPGLGGAPPVRPVETRLCSPILTPISSQSEMAPSCDSWRAASAAPRPAGRQHLFWCPPPLRADESSLRPRREPWIVVAHAGPEPMAASRRPQLPGDRVRRRHKRVHGGRPLADVAERAPAELPPSHLRGLQNSLWREYRIFSSSWPNRRRASGWRRRTGGAAPRGGGLRPGVVRRTVALRR